MSGNGDTNKDGKWTPLLVAVVGAIVGGSGTIGIFLGTPIGQEVVRADPFTGSQAAPLIEDIAFLKRDLIAHKLTHPDRELDLRLTLLEAQYQHITDTLDRIEGKMDQ